jgi:hypothetical protein
MPSHRNYAAAISKFNESIDDMAARVQQDRVLHMHDLTSTYMQAVTSGMPHEYLSMLEQTIGERSVYNDRKMVLDAADLTMQGTKLNRALGANVGTLNGGGVADNSRQALKGMHYSAQRSNALHANFNQKLQHDRAVHASELEALLTQTPGGSQVASVLTSLVNMRTENNTLRTAHDASRWAELDSYVGHALGGGGNADSVLSHGVNQTLSGGGTNTSLRGGGSSAALESSNFHFANSDAARLWQQIRM